MRRDPAKKRHHETGDEDEDKENADPSLSTPPPTKKQRRRADEDCPSPPSDSGMYRSNPFIVGPPPQLNCIYYLFAT